MIKEITKEESVEELQGYLDVLYEWQRKNNMKYNGGKCQVVRLGAYVDLKDTLLFTDQMGEVGTPKETVKDLGFQVDHISDFRHQLVTAVKKARNKAAW